MQKLYKMPELKVPINQLLRRGFSDGVLLIRDQNGRHLIELRKYLFPMENYGVMAVFHEDGLEEKDARAIEKYCVSHELECASGGVDSARAEADVSIDFNKDVTKAHEFVEFALMTLWGVTKTSKFIVTLRNCSAWDELISTPHQKPLPIKDGFRQFGQSIERAVGIAIWDVCLFATLGLLQLVGSFGVVYSLIFQNKTWTLVKIDAIGVSFVAPMIGFAFFGLILIGSLRVFTSSFWKRGRNVSARNSQKNIIVSRFLWEVLSGRSRFDTANLIALVVIMWALFSWGFRG